MASSVNQWLLHLFSILVCFSSSTIPISSAATQFHKIPRLGIIDRNKYNRFALPKALESKDFHPYFFKQTLDHFNYNEDSYTKFKQYYVINYKYWGGANSSSPIFAYLGAESALDGDIPTLGFLTENAPRFKALLVYMEHRFYGKSNPVGSMEKSLELEVRGYFSSAQALADYAEILLHIKRKLSALHSPVIVFGGSYGGMLASWFRLKYPHIALGALASSAPVLYFDNLTPQNKYHSILSADFKEAGEKCYETIRKSWSVIDKVASQPKGLTVLSQKFKTCKHLNSAPELTGFLSLTYVRIGQYDAPPEYPVNKFCKGVDKAPKGAGVLDRIFAGIVSLKGNSSCYDTAPPASTETDLGWGWQTCTEIVFPIGHGNETMFPAAPFVLSDYMENCKSSWGVSPRPHWITTHYGGHDMKLIFKRFGSNIIFSNGLRDPYSGGGVLENLSESIIALHTKEGSHCVDLMPYDHERDPAWLVAQRKAEVEIIEGWIKSYKADLAAIKGAHAHP